MSLAIFFDCQYQYPTGFKLDVQMESDAQVTGLIGPSGSGKTTVLSLIAGLIRPAKGKIEVDQVVLNDSNSRLFLRPEQRQIGMLFQNQNLFPHLNVQANINYSRRRRKQSKIDVQKVIATLELGDLLKRFPRTLSGGQQQRVALGRAIASHPKLLLLDEPLTSVEPDLRDRITDFTERVINEFRIPTIVVSHNSQLVERLASRIVKIEQGRVANGNPAT